MKNIADKTVAEIVTENIKTADVFKKNGIDFCCGGHTNVVEVCAKKGIDFDSIKTEILAIDAKVSNSHDFKTWDLDFLVDYIIKTHHKYVIETSALILQYAGKVAKVHGHHYAEVIEINTLFHALVKELKSHLQKEEVILFPFIKTMVAAQKNRITLARPGFGSIQNPINMMEKEHDGAGDIIKKITELTNSFTPPAEACNTFRALYAKLEEFQNDLFQHIHLENNILFPKAIQLEKAFF